MNVATHPCFIRLAVTLALISGLGIQAAADTTIVVDDGKDPGELTPPPSKVVEAEQSTLEGMVQLEELAVYLLQSPGDFNRNGILDGGDMDVVSVVLRDGLTQSPFDLSNDGILDQRDREIWVTELAGSVFGDADLNGLVELQDFLILLEGYSQPGGWSDGDFNGNLAVEFSDFLTLAQNFGTRGVAVGTMPVPEPESSSLLLLAAVSVLLRRQVRRFAMP